MKMTLKSDPGVPEKVLRRLVFSALNNALENGYDESATNPINVANDLYDLDAAIQDLLKDPGCVYSLLPFIKDWQQASEADRAMVLCTLCRNDCFLKTAHLHQGQYIGDECCWDERLRSSE